MTFEAWLAEQRCSIVTLRVLEGEYVARYSERFGTFAATRKLTRMASGTPVIHVSRRVLTRARVVFGESEYDFAPLWTQRQGVEARRCAPAEVRDPEATMLVKGFATAAILAAAKDEFDRLVTIARDTSENEADAVLRRLTTDGAADLEDSLRLALASVLAERTGGAELAQAAAPCACVVCGRAYRPGEDGPLYQFESTTICTACLRPEARAA